MTEPNVTRKVRQLSNDVNAIYSILDRVEKTQQEHTVVLAAVRNAVSEVRGVQIRQASRLDGIDVRFDGVDVRFDGVDARFDGLDVRFDGVDAQFDRLETRFDGLETRFGGLETRFGGLEGTVSTIDGKLDKVVERLA